MTGWGIAILAQSGSAVDKISRRPCFAAVPQRHYWLLKSDSGKRTMHGFAQRALPLLVEAGPSLPSGNKRDGKPARPPAGHFWQLYLALPHAEKMLMQVKALLGHAVNKTVSYNAVRQAGLRLPDGRAYSTALLNEQLQALQRKGLLDGTLDCIPEIMHPVAAGAGQSEGGTDLISAVKAAIPKSEREDGGRPYYWRYPPLSQDIALFRHLRLSVYANDEAEFGRLCRLAGAEAAKFEDSVEFARFVSGFPVSLTWLKQLRPAIREVFAERALHMLIEQGQQTDETGAVIQHYANAAPGETGAVIGKLLLRFDILSANFDQARLTDRGAAGKRGASRRRIRSVYRVSDRRQCGGPHRLSRRSEAAPEIARQA